MGTKETPQTKAARAQRDRERKQRAKDLRIADPKEAEAYRRKEAAKKQKTRQKKNTMFTPSSADKKPAAVPSIRSNAVVPNIRSISPSIPGSPDGRTMVGRSTNTRSGATRAPGSNAPSTLDSPEDRAMIARRSTNSQSGAIRAPSWGSTTPSKDTKPAAAAGHSTPGSPNSRTMIASTPQRRSTPFRFRSPAIQQSVDRVSDFYERGLADIDRHDAELKKAREEYEAKREKRKKVRRALRDARSLEDKQEDDDDDTDNFQMLKDQVKESSLARASMFESAMKFEAEHQLRIAENPEAFAMEGDAYYQPPDEGIDTVEDSDDEEYNYEPEAAVHISVHEPREEEEEEEEEEGASLRAETPLQEIQRDLPSIPGSPNNDVEEAHTSAMQNGGDEAAKEAAKAKAFFEQQQHGSVGGAAGAPGSGLVFGGNNAAAASGPFVAGKQRSGRTIVRWEHCSFYECTIFRWERCSFCGRRAIVRWEWCSFCGQRTIVWRRQ